jgi:indole-3-glycerol phosphate synthase
LNILDKIVDQVRIKVEEQKKILALAQIQNTDFTKQKPDEFKIALNKPGIQIIAEIKKFSPSAGLIDKEFNPLKIAGAYEAANVAAISVLTEEDFFKGSLEILQQVRNFVSLPLLRKDFIIDLYQIYQSKYFGANCILLIASILSEQELKDFSRLAKELKLDALVEVHNESELDKALSIDTEIIGINNRNLTTFKVDVETSLRLKEKIPTDIITVSESGIKNHRQVKELEQAGFDAILIGESLMRAEHKKEKIRSLLGVDCPPSLIERG